MKNTQIIISIFLISAALFSCGGGEKHYVLSLIPFQESERGSWGFINMEGKVIIEPEFSDKPTVFKDGFAIVYKDGYRYINEKGELSGKKYADATLFEDGIAVVVEENNAPMGINQQFEKVFSLPDVYSVGMFSEGMARFSNLEGKYGFIDNKGKQIIPAKYDYVGNFREGMAIAKTTDKNGTALLGFIDKEGKEVIKLSDKFTDLKDFSEGKAAIEQDGKWGFINTKGEIVIKANNYDDVTNFYGGYASYKDGQEWGLIDEKGEKIIRAKYDNPLLFMNGKAAVLKDRNVQFIKIDGEKAFDIDYAGVALPFLDDIAIVKDGRSFVFIGSNGKATNKNEFRNVDDSPYANLIYNNRYYNPNIVIKSQYVDFEKLANVMVDNASKFSYQTNMENSLTLMEVSQETYNKAKDWYRSRGWHSTESPNQFLTYKVEFTFDNYMILGDYNSEERSFNPDTHLKQLNYQITLQENAANKHQEFAQALTKALESKGIKVIETKAPKYEYSDTVLVLGDANGNKIGAISYNKYAFHLGFQMKAPENGI